MLVQTLTKRLNKHKLALVALALAGAVLAMVTTLFMKMEYQTTSRFIIIQEQRFSDAFTQAKSAEYISGILSRIVSTDSFREAVFDKYEYLEPLFPEVTDEQRKVWNKSIAVVPFKDTGILSISAYNVDRSYAEAIVFAVGDTLSNNVKSYLGNGAAIQIKPIDGPITTDYPARPSFTRNTVYGLLFGLLVGVLFFGFAGERPERRVQRYVPQPLPVVPRPLVRPATRFPAPRPVEHKKGAQFSAKEFDQWLKKPAKA